MTMLNLSFKIAKLSRDYHISNSFEQKFSTSLLKVLLFLNSIHILIFFSVIRRSLILPLQLTPPSTPTSPVGHQGIVLNYVIHIKRGRRKKEEKKKETGMNTVPLMIYESFKVTV